MRFNFRLQKVLDHRQSILNLAQKDFSLAQADLFEAEQTLESFINSIKSAEDRRLQLIQAGEAPAESLSQIHHYIKGMDLKLESQKGVVQQKLDKVEELRLILQERAIDCKILEKLKEKQREDFRMNQRKKEEKQISESVNSRFHLRQGNG